MTQILTMVGVLHGKLTHYKPGTTACSNGAEMTRTHYSLVKPPANLLTADFTTYFFNPLNRLQGYIPPSMVPPVSAGFGGTLDYNFCLMGAEDMSMAAINPLTGSPTVATMQQVFGIMLSCKDSSRGYAMMVERYYGNCVDAGPVNTYRIPLASQDAFLRGDCIGLGDMGHIQMTLLQTPKVMQIPGVGTIPVSGTNLMQNCQQLAASGRVVPPKSAKPAPKDMDWIRKRWTEVVGTPFEEIAPTWKSRWTPSKDDPPLEPLPGSF